MSTEQAVLEKLELRHKERLQEIERKRKEQEEKSSKPGHFDYFVKELTERKKNIEDAIDEIGCGKITEKSILENELDNINESIRSLEEFTAKSKHYIRDYDIRKSIEVIRLLRKKLEGVKCKILPSVKFSFGDNSMRKLNDSPNLKDLDVVDSLKSNKPSAKELLEMYMGESLGFSNRVGEDLSLNDERMQTDEVELSKLENCTVKMFGSPCTLHMTQLKNCKIYSGPVATSVLIENCVDCIFLIPCQQLRIHNTENCDFYTHITSRTVIENTTNVRFAPFNWQYDGIDDHFKISGLNRNKNNWDSIDDFTACTSGKQSQNWSILPENERIKQWDL